MGNLAMIITTEELSRASLAAAGSLITRPEILTKALLKGGTEAQKQQWLPPIAAGEIMVGISVTEPDTGSDVASVQVPRRARPRCGGTQGWVINGAKAWCTFAGRANVLALLRAHRSRSEARARTGLSLFIVPKDALPRPRVRDEAAGRRHAARQGRRARPATAACTRSRSRFENYFVPAENLVGEAGGLRTRASTCRWRLRRRPPADRRPRQRRLRRRRSSGPPSTPTTASSSASRSASFQLTQYKLGRMATHLMAGAPAHLRRGARDGRATSRSRSSRRWRSCSPATSPCG